MNTTIDGITIGDDATEEKNSNVQSLKYELIIKRESGTSLVSYEYNSNNKAIVTKAIAITESEDSNYLVS